MNTEQQIALYSTAFYICLAVMAAGFALAAFFLIRFKIPRTIALITGRAGGKSFEKMKKGVVSRSEEEAEKERDGSAKSRCRDPETEDHVTEYINPPVRIRFTVTEYSAVVHTDEFI